MTSIVHEPKTFPTARVVVVTGASSGIGRATALAYAARGARVVLAARRLEPLEAAATACRDAGGEAAAVATDVTDPVAVVALREAALARFGRIDVWINNAGTGVFGPYQDADIALHRRVIEVNLLGTMHGAHAVLPVFLRQGRGTLINMVSLGGWSPTPYAASYTASKFGLRGFSASLRAELAQHPAIHVCAVFPAMIDTPGFVHGANVSGRTLDPGPFLYRPEEVAATMLALADTPRDEVAVGWPARAAQLAYTVARGPTERGIGAVMRGLLARGGPAPKTQGALLAPVAAGTESDGGHLARRGIPSASALTHGLLGVLAVGAVAWAWRPRRRHHMVARARSGQASS